MTELIIHTKTFLPVKEGNEENLKLLFDNKKKDFIIKYKGFNENYSSNRFCHYEEFKLGGIMQFKTKFFDPSSDKEKDKQCDDFIVEIIPIIKEKLGEDKIKKPKEKSVKTTPEEAKWFSDLETMKAHLHKWKRDEMGLLHYDTKENAEGYMRVSIENSDRFVKEENEKIRKENEKDKKPEDIFKPQGQVKFYIEEQPIFYDKSDLWWVWNKVELKWEISNEVDILNHIEKLTSKDIITPKNRTIILNSLKQECRKSIPKDIKPTWIQFKDRIFDVTTGENFEATPDYLSTNPIPWNLHNGNYEETPTMDRIFEEWVGKDYVKTLYEIIAYCLIPAYPLNRLFCFIGGGMNGKTCYLNLLQKFLGKDNCCSTELDTLITSRFEITRLHKKLACLMGETNFNEMNKTSWIKKLTGGDLIGYEYKNKPHFHDYNYAKILIATNNLPTTTDKTLGFYRRWLIIDFPNKFSEKKDILSEIPDEEYEALALKCTGILNNLLIRREFTNEGSVEERMEKYESKSDFLQRFLEEFTIERVDKHITKADFYKKFKDWCKENRHREMAENTIGKKMKEKNIEAGKIYVNWLHEGKGGQMKVWLDLKWKD